MTVRLRVVVTPKSSCDEIVGWRGDEIAARVRAVPESGKANVAVSDLFANALGVPKTAVAVERGGRSRHKVLAIEGIGSQDVLRVLGAPD